MGEIGQRFAVDFDLIEVEVVAGEQADADEAAGDGDGGFEDEGVAVDAAEGFVGFAAVDFSYYSRSQPPRIRHSPGPPANDGRQFVTLAVLIHAWSALRDMRCDILQAIQAYIVPEYYRMLKTDP